MLAAEQEKEEKGGGEERRRRTEGGRRSLQFRAERVSGVEAFRPCGTFLRTGLDPQQKRGSIYPVSEP